MGTPGTGVGNDGDPSPALGASRATPAVVFVKAARASHAWNVDKGTVESWKPSDVSATLNVNDNTGDTRATVVKIDAEPAQNCSCCPVDPKPDSARYRACGNAVTVQVVTWIGERLLKAHLDVP